MTTHNGDIATIALMDCPIHSLTMAETVDRIDKAIAGKKPLHHVVVNVAKLVNMQRNPELKASVVASDIINADGQGVVWAARLLGRPLPERVAGIDLMGNLVALAHDKNYRIFFFGAKEEVVKKVVEKYSEQYSPAIIAGYRNGYYTAADEPSIAESIAASDADILFVAITSPKKEIFLNQYKDIIQTPFIMGVGGSFDVVSGITKRAPLWMQRAGLEWFFRVLQEPRRMWKRYLVTNTLFLGYLVRECFRKKKPVAAV
ncbi:WecB/TagA/CpsF family glycosyltransferase [Taibaiella koreensis]|uniref:WecB/TagA/CpsF family glycosyltransferase n=1 Tax=Taibaiella koreensis TaxID=1268548 RepID=UPI000E59A519|nr:WecB/TagA/CpsF family glycosyltransferase [Taibaiella koreensis]